jgi:hypothetical protein
MVECGLPARGAIAGTIRDSYVAANKVEQSSRSPSFAFRSQSLVKIETFHAVERALLRHVERSTRQGKPRPAATHIPPVRLFWAEAIPAEQARRA